MDLFEYWKIIRKRLWLIVLLVVVVGADAVYLVRQQTTTYRTSTTLAINPASPSPLLPGSPPETIDALATSYIQFMRTRAFASLVAAELDVVLSEAAILSALAARPVRGTQFFEILATFPDPDVAQDLANTAANILVNSNDAPGDEAELARAREIDRLRELLVLLEDELTYHDEQIREMDAELNQLEERPPSQENDARIAELRRDLLNLRAARVEVLKSVADVQSTLASLSDPATAANRDQPMILVDPAPLGRPLPRDTLRLLFAAIVGALALGVTLAWLLDFLDTSVKTPEQLDALYGVPTLGSIGSLAKGRGEHALPLVALEQSDTPVAEAFRRLRTAVHIAGLEKPIGSLLVTSAEPGEGKTFVATNLAVSFALAGYRVLLVDADLRHPQVHQVLDLPQEPGLTELIWRGQLHVQETEIETLQVITSGAVPTNPAELLGSARAAELLDAVLPQVDLILYDAPPVLAVTDAFQLATRVDAALQVVRAGRTRRALVQQARTLLAQTGVRLLGPVLNGAATENLGYYATQYRYYAAQNGRREGSHVVAQILGSARHRTLRQDADNGSDATQKSGQIEQ